MKSQLRFQLAAAVLFPVLLFSYSNCAPNGFAPKERQLNSESGANSSEEPPATQTPPVAGNGPSPTTPPPTMTPPTIPPTTPPVVTPPAGKVAVLLAQGEIERTMLSCDDGRTWIKNRSANDASRCHIEGANYVECDHTAMTARGLDFGDGTFFAAWGWGAPTRAMRTRDGVSWVRINMQTAAGTVAGIHYNNGHLTWFSPFFGSNNEGDSWLALNGGPYSIPRTTARSGAFIAVSGDSVSDARFSQDSGRTFFSPRFTGDLVWARTVKIASNAGTVVSLSNVGSNLYLGVSRDSGVSWEGRVLSTSAFESQVSYIDYYNGKFTGFFGGRRWESVDGTTWTNQVYVATGPILTDSKPIIGRTHANGFVAFVNGGFPSGYDKQRLYTSPDGLVWTEVAAANYTRSHPIKYVLRGTVDEAACR